jgi:hypothetical protein
VSFRDGVIEKVDPVHCIGRYVNVFGKRSVAGGNRGLPL